MEHAKDMVPALRFQGFTDAWEQRKLDDVATKIGSGKTPRGGSAAYVVSGIPFLRSQNIYDDNTHLTDVVFISNETDQEMKNSRVEFGDVLLNITGASIGRSAVYKYRVPANVNQHVCIVRLSPANAPQFTQLQLAGRCGQDQISSFQAGGAREGLNFQQIAQMRFQFPNLEEQYQLGEFFRKLDEIIALRKRKLNTLRCLKSYLLGSSFPLPGSVKPHLRFAGNTRPWTSRKLGDIGATKSGIGFPDVEQGGNEGVPFFKISDMNTAGNEKYMIFANNSVTTDQVRRLKWKPIETTPAVIFAKVGAALLLNRKRLVTFPFLIDNNTMAYIFDKSWDCEFGAALFETINLPKYAQIGALPSFNGSEIENITIAVPEIDEQIRIGEMFNYIDTIITMDTRKLNRLRELKDSLLRKMFI